MSSRLILSLLLFAAAALFLDSCASLSEQYGSYRAADAPLVEDFPFPGLSDSGYASVRISYRGTVYNVFAWRADTLHTELMLSRETASFRPLTRLERSVRLVESRGGEVLLAANAGMFLPDLTPAGLYIEEGVELYPMRIEADRTNFGMLPNGVFAIAESGFTIAESTSFGVQKALREYPYATQSGPLLLENGAIHPRFNRNSSNRYVRSGVGVTTAGVNPAAYYAISETPVNFYEFAAFFRDVLLCREALYLDGHISRAYIPGIGRDQAGGRFGPLLVVSDPEGGSRIDFNAKIELIFRFGS